MWRWRSIGGGLHADGGRELETDGRLPNELDTALRAYGLQADTITPVPGNSCHVDPFHLSSGGREYLARIRHPLATPAEVIFAAHWARAVIGEVPVPVGLLPNGDVPRVRGRCVDVCNYIPCDDTNGGEVHRSLG